MSIEKGLAVAAGVVFIGLVGYRIVQKKKPELLKKARKSASDVTKRASKIAEKARASFRAGYAGV